MKYDPETLCLMISLELNRFPRAGDHWELCDPRWPDMVAIKVAQLGEQYISVNGEDFYKWLHMGQNRPHARAQTKTTQQTTHTQQWERYAQPLKQPTSR